MQLSAETVSSILSTGKSIGISHLALKKFECCHSASVHKKLNNPKS